MFFFFLGMNLAFTFSLQIFRRVQVNTSLRIALFIPQAAMACVYGQCPIETPNPVQVSSV